MKLGEILTKLRVIDEDQLREALNAQLIYGGHLGTCLIEQGCITEQQLGRVLAKSFGVPCATTAMFTNIPKYAIDSLPRALVEKHHAVPFRLEDKKLDIALLLPNDLQVIDELSFASGRKVVPWIAPEVRLLQAMDRYYGIARRMRHITLARQLDDVSETPHAAGPRKAAAVVPEITRTAAVMTERAQTPAKVDDPLEPLANLLCRVTGETMLGQITIEHTAPEASRSIMFTVRSGSALPWDWRGFDLDRDRAAKMRFPIAGEPLFSLLLGESYYRGPVPDDSRYHRFYETLGIERPDELILVPAHADDRLVALLYFDSGNDKDIQGKSSAFCRIARKVGLALNLIQIKQQIRTV